MGLHIEIAERNSVIVMTITGPTDVGALEPLQGALRVAASEGRTVVLDISGLTDASSLTGILDSLGPAAATLKLVFRPSPTSPQPASHFAAGAGDLYSSVGAAIDAIRSGRSYNSDPSDDDLAAKFDSLSGRYAEVINRCRQLLESAEASP